MRTIRALEERIRVVYDVVRGRIERKARAGDLDLAWTLEVPPEQEAAMAPTVKKMLAVLRREYRRRQAEAEAKAVGP